MAFEQLRQTFELRGSLAPIDEQTLADFEARIGARLPDDYRELLSTWGQGTFGGWAGGGRTSGDELTVTLDDGAYFDDRDADVALLVQMWLEYDGYELVAGGNGLLPWG